MKPASYPRYHFKPVTKIILFLILFTLSSFATCRTAQAVSPPPDGGYPNFTTAEGQNALLSLSTGAANTAVGWSSLLSNATGSFNTATGAGALLFNTADENTAVGAAALLSSTTGSRSTAVGATALLNNTTGSENTAIGAGALRNNTTGVVNIALGRIAGLGVTTASNVICIGSIGANVNDSTWISNIYGVTTQSGTTAPVVVSDGGQLGTLASAERFKKDIATMDKASEIILSLRPVTFHYKSDARETPQFGLIAEEVAKVNPALVLPDKKGKPYTVRYEAVNAMLLNEFLKEHKSVEEQKGKLDDQARKIQQQEATIAELKKEMQVVVARLKAQDSKIQKVSDQVQITSPSPQMAASTR